MAHTFTFKITVTLTRTQGKFASREELAEAIQSELEGADPGQINAGDDGEYEVESFEVDEYVEPKAPRAPRAKKVAAPAPVTEPAPAEAPLPKFPAPVTPSIKDRYTLLAPAGSSRLRYRCLACQAEFDLGYRSRERHEATDQHVAAVAAQAVSS